MLLAVARNSGSIEYAQYCWQDDSIWNRACNITDQDTSTLPASCDLALFVNAYHHVADGPAFVRRLARCLKRGGRLVAIDWAYRETPKGPPMNRRIPPAEIIAAARRAGLRLTARHDFLPYQDFLVFTR